MSAEAPIILNITITLLKFKKKKEREQFENISDGGTYLLSGSLTK